MGTKWQSEPAVSGVVALPRSGEAFETRECRFFAFPFLVREPFEPNELRTSATKTQLILSCALLHFA